MFSRLNSKNMESEASERERARPSEAEAEEQEHTSCRTIKICIDDHFKADRRYVRQMLHDLERTSLLHQRLVMHHVLCELNSM